MFKLFDRVKVNTPTTGTGDVTFGSVSSNAFQTPAEAGAGDGDTVRYLIVDGTDFELGIGTIKNSVAEMERTTVKESKIGGTDGTSKISLSGTAVLSLTASAADILVPVNNLADLDDASTALTNLGGTTLGKSLFTAADEAAALAALPSAYHKANILGTVSQSSGVPTGAIIESGSNANGSYVRYADGTMVCWGTKASPTISAWSGSGNLFYSQLSSFSFPATFASTPTGHLTFSDNNVSARSAQVCTYNFSTTGINTIYITTVISGAATSSTGSNLYFTAFGRWF